MIRQFVIAFIAAPCVALAGATLAQAAVNTGSQGMTTTANAKKPCDTNAKNAKCKPAAAKPAAKSAAGSATQKTAPASPKPRESEPKDNEQFSGLNS